MSSILDKKKFFEDFAINEKHFKSTGLNWEGLLEIFEDYLLVVPHLERVEEEIVSKLIDGKNVHSVRRRVKKPTHLIEKIIRRGHRYKELNIDVSNYKEIVNDLIGIRVLHLFKDDWKEIHKLITLLWKFREVPEVNIRRGDYNISQLKQSLNCNIKIREHGYRSVHYLIEYEDVLAEIQVRTVFEEAWGEIDHIMRYPYGTCSPVIDEYLAIFNRIVGAADEMGTFLQKLQKDMQTENYIEIARKIESSFK